LDPFESDALGRRASIAGIAHTRGSDPMGFCCVGTADIDILLVILEAFDAFAALRGAGAGIWISILSLFGRCFPG
jgi:hypothetical protein